MRTQDNGRFMFFGRPSADGRKWLKNLNFSLKVVKSRIKDVDTKSIVLAGLEEDSWP